MNTLSMLKLPCMKRVKFDSCLTTEDGAGGKHTHFSTRLLADKLFPDIEPVEAGTELESTTEHNAASCKPVGLFEDELFQFHRELELFPDSWPDCKNVRDLSLIAGLDEHQEECLENLISGTTSSPLREQMTEVATSYVRSIHAEVPDWPDWSMIPRIRPKEDDDDAGFLIALLVHCFHVVKSRQGQVGEYIADIIVDAFYEYEPFMLPP